MFQEACKQLKVVMDKKFGAPWQVAIGEGAASFVHHVSIYDLIIITFQALGLILLIPLET